MGKNWIELALDRESWRVLVNAVINLSCPIKCKQIDDKVRTCQLLRKYCAAGSGSVR
jgi:hypothetical protein